MRDIASDFSDAVHLLRAERDALKAECAQLRERVERFRALVMRMVAWLDIEEPDANQMTRAYDWLADAGAALAGGEK